MVCDPYNTVTVKFKCSKNLLNAIKTKSEIPIDDLLIKLLEAHMAGITLEEYNRFGNYMSASPSPSPAPYDDEY
jgi:hypothetical protein